MVKEMRKEDASKFLKKGEEFYSLSLENYQKKRLNACVFDASQAIILANDAFCIFNLGRRASKDHREAISLHVQAALSRENKKETVAEALEKRGAFGDTEKETTEKDANLLLIRSRRFLDWVNMRVKS